MVKVYYDLISNDSTWETEDNIKQLYPNIFLSNIIFKEKKIVVGDNCNASPSPLSLAFSFPSLLFHETLFYPFFFSLNPSL